MVDLETFIPSSVFNRPAICSGDHCSLRMSPKTRVRTCCPMDRLPGGLALRRFVLRTARCALYTPFSLELRFISRETVLTDTFIVSAMNFNVHFLWSKTEIVYLCSEINCLYIICNTKLVNLREENKFFLLFLHCLSNTQSSLGATRPQPQGKPPRCFSWN